MKPEPLKGKIAVFRTEIGDYHYFEIYDVKSAVEWLLQEIQRKKKECSSTRDEEKLMLFTATFSWVEGKIKEAFADVVDEEEEK